MHQITEAFDALRRADRILVGAGAGMGVDSGLPDFRGKEGFWNAYPAFKERGLSFYDLANPRWFRTDPEQAWGFYGHRMNLYRATQPHTGFRQLLDLIHLLDVDYFVYTSNVDGHFQRSGYVSNKVIECHGSLNHLQCRAQCCRTIWEHTDSIEIDEVTFRATGPLPSCPFCDGPARPNVLMFGDSGWIEDRTELQEKRYRNWLNEGRQSHLVAIEFGAGTAVPSVRYECSAQAAELIRVNPRESHGGARTISVALGALDTINQLSDLVNQT